MLKNIICSVKKLLLTGIALKIIFWQIPLFITCASAIDKNENLVQTSLSKTLEEQSKKDTRKVGSTNLYDEHSEQQIVQIYNGLSAKEEEAIVLLSEKIGLPFEIVKEKLHFKIVKDGLRYGDCYLVPLQKIEDHRLCLLEIFSNARPEYMKFYLDGKLKTPQKTEQVYFINAYNRMWLENLPRSLNFIICCNGESVGRIAVGPMVYSEGIDSEIGYAIKEEYAGKGIMSSAVQTLLNFLQYLLSNNIYGISRVRATAKPDNIASNRILVKNNFIKSENLVNDGYALENEYFYYFNQAVK